MRSAFVGLMLASMLVACHNSTDVTSGAKQTLDRNQALWEQRTFGSYRYDLALQDEAFSAVVRITVNGTTVMGVTTVTGTPVSGEYAYPTIDDLLATAQAAFGQNNTELQMDFNQQYGYPTMVVVTTMRPTGLYSAQVSNFVAIP